MACGAHVDGCHACMWTAVALAGREEQQGGRGGHTAASLPPDGCCWRDHVRDIVPKLPLLKSLWCIALVMLVMLASTATAGTSTAMLLVADAVVARAGPAGASSMRGRPWVLCSVFHVFFLGGRAGGAPFFQLASQSPYRCFVP